MKLDINCVRDVLLEIEEFPLGYQPLDSFKKSIQKHGELNVLYTLYKLHEAKYINAEIGLDEGGFPHCMAVYNMTFQGHEFLNSVRSPGVWEQLSEAASEGGTACLKVVGDIAIDIAKEALKAKFGLK